MHIKPMITLYSEQINSYYSQFKSYIDNLENNYNFLSYNFVVNDEKKENLLKPEECTSLFSDLGSKYEIYAKQGEYLKDSYNNYKQKLYELLRNCGDDFCYGESDSELCQINGYECGSSNAIDSCGIEQAINCGNCPSGFTCEENQCIESELFTLSLNSDPIDASEELIGAGEYAQGTEILINVIPNDGFDFVNWTNSADELISEEIEFTFTMPAYDVELKANFIDCTAILYSGDDCTSCPFGSYEGDCFEQDNIFSCQVYCSRGDVICGYNWETIDGDTGYDPESWSFELNPCEEVISSAGCYCSTPFGIEQQMFTNCLEAYIENGEEYACTQCDGTWICDDSDGDGVEDSLDCAPENPDDWESSNGYGCLECPCGSIDEHCYDCNGDDAGTLGSVCGEYEDLPEEETGKAGILLPVTWSMCH
jgi:hypothetical protein